MSFILKLEIKSIVKEFKIKIQKIDIRRLLIVLLLDFLIKNTLNYLRRILLTSMQGVKKN